MQQALAMRPQFFDDLNLKIGRRTVPAGGPCHWEAGDAWAEITNVTHPTGQRGRHQRHRLHHCPQQ